jgi:hypothetical protein
MFTLTSQFILVRRNPRPLRHSGSRARFHVARVSCRTRRDGPLLSQAAPVRTALLNLDSTLEVVILRRRRVFHQKRSPRTPDSRFCTGDKRPKSRRYVSPSPRGSACARWRYRRVFEPLIRPPCPARPRHRLPIVITSGYGVTPPCHTRTHVRQCCGPALGGPTLRALRRLCRMPAAFASSPGHNRGV